ncbi:MAG: beta-lactamase family protein [Bacteroidales bacterium]|nr:MAG: beta-lactamase family protein [Bacteroidales bacterium]
MNYKKILIGGLFIILFFGEIAITFSYKGESNRNTPVNEITPLSYRLTNELSSNSSMASIDSIFEDFIKRKKIKGASVALTKDSKLIYAKGFGLADEETGTMVEPKHVFRIASVSKLITAVTIMKIAEEGMIEINDHVFGPEGILNDSVYLNYKDKRVEEITILNLLNHTSGWNNKKDDPLFQSLSIARKMNVEPPADIETIIKYYLQKNLYYNPGTRYSYSNFGYAVLGKVIEKVTGMSYEDYVQFAILHPIGIYDMHVGKSSFSERFKNEVCYYVQGRDSRVYSFDGSGKLAPQVYGGNNIELLSAAGGWVASAPELMKLIVAIDGFPEKPDILSDETVKLMTMASRRTRKLIGWRGADGYGTWWRTGTLAGTSALIMRNKNGINWVVLMNTSTKGKSKIHNEISKIMFKAVKSVEEWPDYDLFNYNNIEPALAEK